MSVAVVPRISRHKQQTAKVLKICSENINICDFIFILYWLARCFESFAALLAIADVSDGCDCSQKLRSADIGGYAS